MRFPQNPDDSYPAQVVVDFSKLPASTLQRYIEHHADTMLVRPEANKHELAAGVAQHFEHFLEVEREDDTINSFISLCRQGGHSRRKRRKTNATKGASAAKRGGAAGTSAEASGTTTGGASGVGRRRCVPKVISSDCSPGQLREGEKVAAKHNSTWILGSIIRYVASREQYEVQDEDYDSGDDDSAATFLVDWKGTAPLPRVENEGDYRSRVIGWQNLAVHTRVLAMYPHTTSFYPATVIDSKRNDTVVQFDDDDDPETHRPRKTNVPNRYILECL